MQSILTSPNLNHLLPFNWDWSHLQTHFSKTSPPKFDPSRGGLDLDLDDFQKRDGSRPTGDDQRISDESAPPLDDPSNSSSSSSSPDSPSERDSDDDDDDDDDSVIHSPIPHRPPTFHGLTHRRSKSFPTMLEELEEQVLTIDSTPSVVLTPPQEMVAEHGFSPLSLQYTVTQAAQTNGDGSQDGHVRRMPSRIGVVLGESQVGDRRENEKDFAHVRGQFMSPPHRAESDPSEESTRSETPLARIQNASSGPSSTEDLAPSFLKPSNGQASYSASPASSLYGSSPPSDLNVLPEAITPTRQRKKMSIFGGMSSAKKKSKRPSTAASEMTNGFPCGTIDSERKEYLRGDLDDSVTPTGSRMRGRRLNNATEPPPLPSSGAAPVETEDGAATRKSFWRLGRRSSVTGGRRTSSHSPSVSRGTSPTRKSGRATLETGTGNDSGRNTSAPPPRLTQRTLGTMRSFDSIKSQGPSAAGCRINKRAVAASSTTIAPRPIKVKSKSKNQKSTGDFDRLFLSQEIVLSADNSFLSSDRNVDGGRGGSGSLGAAGSSSSRKGSLIKGPNGRKGGGLVAGLSRRASIQTSGSSSRDSGDGQTDFVPPSFSRRRSDGHSGSVDVSPRPPLPHVDSASSVNTHVTVSTVATSLSNPSSQQSKSALGSDENLSATTEQICARARKACLPSSSPNDPLLKGKAAAAAAATKKSTWALQFSNDGRYLASAGQDCVVRVFEVLSDASDRQEELEEARIASVLGQYDGLSGGGGCEGVASSIGGASGSERLTGLAIFKRRPIKEFRGHTSDILDLNWSKNNFLLSSSMDGTVRLWHVTRSECLCTFGMPDMVTGVSFHPKDDRYFISGGLDGKLRLWNIPAKKVQSSQEVPGLITAVAFTESGKVACVGTFTGAALFYDVSDKLTYSSSIAVRRRSSTTSGSSKKGGSNGNGNGNGGGAGGNSSNKASKITGIQAVVKGGGGGGDRIMITSNDSRIRFYDLGRRRLGEKLKANHYVNRSSQIRANASQDGTFIVSGSEDDSGGIHVWDIGGGGNVGEATSLQPPPAPLHRYWTNPNHGGGGTVTCAVMAPLSTHLLLTKSLDPILSSSSPDPRKNRIVVSVDQSSTLRVWRVDSFHTFP